MLGGRADGAVVGAATGEVVGVKVGADVGAVVAMQSVALQAVHPIGRENPERQAQKKLLRLTTQDVVARLQLWVPSSHGWNVGAMVGRADGAVVGTATGDLVGIEVGTSVGAEVGRVVVGVAVGLEVGATVPHDVDVRRTVNPCVCRHTHT